MTAPWIARAEFEREGVVHQHDVLRALRDREPTVFAERAAGAAQVRFGAAEVPVEFEQGLVLPEGAHRRESFDHVRAERCFRTAHHGDARAARLDVEHPVPQVVEKRRAGPHVVAGLADAAEQVGVHEVGRHFREPHRQLLGGGPTAPESRGEQAAGALLVELPQGAACIGADLVRRHVPHQCAPRDPQGSQRVIRREECDLDRARVAAAGVQGLRVETARQLAGGADFERPRHRQQDVGAFGDGDVNTAGRDHADGPAFRQR